MTLNESSVMIDGRRIHFYLRNRATQGPTVILLHGGGVDSARLSWELLIPELAQTHRVYAPDFPGYGESDKPEDLPYTTEFMVDFVGKFIKALNIQKASLVGISMGGAVAIGYTLIAPHMVDKLVLVDSYGLQRAAPMHRLSYLYTRAPGVNALTRVMMRSRPIVKYMLGALLHRPGALTPALVDLAYLEATRPGASLAWSAFQRSEMTWEGTRTVYLDRLRTIHNRTLVVHGAEDGLVPVECAREAAALLPDAALAFIEGAGHWPQRDDPETFNRLVLAFLRDHD